MAQLVKEEEYSTNPVRTQHNYQKDVIGTYQSHIMILKNPLILDKALNIAYFTIGKITLEHVKAGISVENKEQSEIYYYYSPLLKSVYIDSEEDVSKVSLSFDMSIQAGTPIIPILENLSKNDVIGISVEDNYSTVTNYEYEIEKKDEVIYGEKLFEEVREQLKLSKLKKKQSDSEDLYRAIYSGKLLEEWLEKLKLNYSEFRQSNLNNIKNIFLLCNTCKSLVNFQFIMNKMSV